jgi:hypothetical protein
VLVIGDYIEVYLNGQLAHIVIDSTHQTGQTHAVAYTFSDADGSLAMQFDDFVFAPLLVQGDPLLIQNAQAVIGRVTASQVVLQAGIEPGTEALVTLAQGDTLVVLARTENSQQLFGYSQGVTGWMNQSDVQLARGGALVNIDRLPVIDPSVSGEHLPVTDHSTPDAGPPPGVDVSLSYGQSATSTLAAESAATWTFYGTANDMVTANATAISVNLDLVITLIGPDGTALISDDDSGFGVNPEIAGYNLPADGVYTIKVSISDGSFAREGDLSVSLSKTN